MKGQRQLMKQLMDSILEVRYSDSEKEKEQSELLLETALSEKDSYGIAFALTYLGDYYIGANDTLKSASYLLEARKLCIKNGFQDLLLTNCCFFGINYQYAHDEQMSFQYNLEGLELARILNDRITESVILNNIGVMFHERKDLREAKKHYLSAYGLLDEESMEASPHLIGALLVNLSEVYCLLGEPEKALTYIHLLEKKKSTDKFSNIFIENEYHRYAAATGNEVQLLETADLILYKQSENLKEKFVTFDIIVQVCENMLNLKNKEYSKRGLDLLTQMNDENATERSRRLLKLKIRYLQIFGSEDKLQEAYRAYYEIAELLEESNNQMVVNGLKTKIRLTKVIKERNVIQKLNEDLESVVHLDELTHLYNRRYFNGIISKFKHNSEVQKIGFIMLDVDYFKEYNDYYGHQEGDRALRAVADCLKSWTYRQLYPCRYGGDEFACLCINMTSGQIEDYIENIRNQLAHLSLEHEKSSCAEYITLSVGYCNTLYTQDLDTVLEIADQALYMAKAKGRNCFLKKEFSYKSHESE